MSLSFFQRRKILKGVNYLELTPFRIYEHQIEDNGLVTVLLPKFENKILKSIFISKNKPQFIRIKLDEFGSEVWLLLDGGKKVEYIAKCLVEKFGDRIQPVNERLTSFLTQLYLQKFISFNEIKN
jgi:Coenzyme PQQ synthesis protein D (PqqD).